MSRVVYFTLLCLSLLMTGCLDAHQKEMNQDVMEGLSDTELITFKKYYTEGKRLYKSKCQNCHGKDGAGLGKLIPPLAGVDFIAENRAKLPCVIRFGMAGELEVEGVIYNQPMPANKKLRPLDIAELLTYIGSSWGNEQGLFPVKEVGQALDDCE